jgi:hypothetical protein
MEQGAQGAARPPGCGIPGGNAEGRGSDPTGRLLLTLGEGTLVRSSPRMYIRSHSAMSLHAAASDQSSGGASIGTYRSARGR